MSGITLNHEALVAAAVEAGIGDSDSLRAHLGRGLPDQASAYTLAFVVAKLPITLAEVTQVDRPTNPSFRCSTANCALRQFAA